jgi:hypothetical protein
MFLCVCVSAAAPDLHCMIGVASLRSLAVAMLEIPSLLNQICLLVALGPRAIPFPLISTFPLLYFYLFYLFYCYLFIPFLFLPYLMLLVPFTIVSTLKMFDHSL